MGEAVIWTIAIGNVLVSERGAVPKAEVLARMPPVRGPHTMDYSPT